MRHIAFILMVLVLATGCASVKDSGKETARETKLGRSAEEVICILGLKPGISTRTDVLDAMGEPYISQPLIEGRYQWIYMETEERQTVFTFADETVIEITSSYDYGTPIR